MRVAVRVMGSFRNAPRAGERSIVVKVIHGSRVADVRRAVGIGDDESWNTSIAGQLVEAEHMLQDGDALFVFAALADGASSLPE